VALHFAIIIAQLQGVAGQMPIPGLSDTSFSVGGTTGIGFWFQAPVAAIVTGMSVPNAVGWEQACRFQVLELLDFNTTQPPNASVATVNATQLFYTNSAPNGTVASMYIPLIAGRFYGVLGASTESIGNPLLYPSFGAVGVFQSQILGVSTLLNPMRSFDTQFSSNVTHPVASIPFNPVGRVYVYVVATPTAAPTAAPSTAAPTEVPTSAAPTSQPTISCSPLLNCAVCIDMNICGACPRGFTLLNGACYASPTAGKRVSLAFWPALTPAELFSTTCVANDSSTIFCAIREPHGNTNHAPTVRISVELLDVHRYQCLRLLPERIHTLWRCMPLATHGR
jgi:hypothetical protein